MRVVLFAERDLAIGDDCDERHGQLHGAGGHKEERVDRQRIESLDGEPRLLTHLATRRLQGRLAAFDAAMHRFPRAGAAYTGGATQGEMLPAAGDGAHHEDIHHTGADHCLARGRAAPPPQIMLRRARREWRPAHSAPRPNGLVR